MSTAANHNGYNFFCLCFQLVCFVIFSVLVLFGFLLAFSYHFNTINKTLVCHAAPNHGTLCDINRWLIPRSFGLVRYDVVWFGLTWYGLM